MSGDKIKVGVRIRPSPDELNGVPSSEADSLCGVRDKSLCLAEKPAEPLAFDYVFHSKAPQDLVFTRTARGIVEDCLDGYNGTIFAYGQTGSGKTFTMMGAEDGSAAGLIPRSLDFLFLLVEQKLGERAEGSLEIRVGASFVELYQEQFYDLLEPSDVGLWLREGDGTRGVFVQGLRSQGIETAAEGLALLSDGLRNRTQAATAMNHESSRSHAIFSLTVTSTEETSEGVIATKTSQLHFVDLAGSERQSDTHSTGQRLKEAGCINKSLSVLAKVISCLVHNSRLLCQDPNTLSGSKKPKFVPYRDSKLTFLLKDSLGGNSRTLIVVNVHPSIRWANETRSTLRFALSAKQIRNRAVVNEAVAGASVDSLRAEIIRLHSQLRDAAAHSGFNEQRVLQLFARQETEVEVLRRVLALAEQRVAQRSESLEQSQVRLNLRNQRITSLEKAFANSTATHLVSAEEITAIIKEGVVTEAASWEAEAVRWRAEAEASAEENARLRSSLDSAAESEGLRSELLLRLKEDDISLLSPATLDLLNQQTAKVAELENLLASEKAAVSASERRREEQQRTFRREKQLLEQGVQDSKNQIGALLIRQDIAKAAMTPPRAANSSRGHTPAATPEEGGVRTRSQAPATVAGHEISAAEKKKRRQTMFNPGSGSSTRVLSRKSSFKPIRMAQLEEESDDDEHKDEDLQAVVMRMDEESVALMQGRLDAETQANTLRQLLDEAHVQLDAERAQATADLDAVSVRLRQLEVTAAEAQTALAEAERLRQLLKTTTESLHLNEAAQSAAQDQLARLEAKLSRATQDAIEFRAAAAEAESRCEVAEDELAALKDEAAQRSEEGTAAEAAAEEKLQEANAALAAELKQAKTNAEAAARREAKYRDLLNEERKECEKVDARMREAGDWKQRQEAYESDIVALQKEKEAFKIAKDDSIAEAARMQAKLESAKAKMGRMAKEKDSWEEREKVLTAKYHELREGGRNRRESKTPVELARDLDSYEATTTAASAAKDAIIEQMRLELDAAQELAVEARAGAADADEERRRADAMQKDRDELSAQLAVLTGHANTNQKIQYVNKIRSENLELKTENIRLKTAASKKQRCASDKENVSLANKSHTSFN